MEASETPKDGSQVVKYDLEQAVLTALDEKYKGIVITDKDSLAMVMGGLRAYRDQRIDLVEWHKVGKAKALKVTRAWDTEKNRIMDLLSPGENRLKLVRKEHEDKIKAVEKKRVDDIRAKIRDISNMDYEITKKSLEEMTALKEKIEGTPIIEKDYEEFVGEAGAAIHNVLISITNAIKNRERLDREEAEHKAEEARLKTIRVKLEAVKKKADDENRKREQLNKAFESQKEWFKKHIKGDSFQTPTSDEAEKALDHLQSMVNDVHEPAIQLLLDEQVEETHGILKFRKDQEKLAADQTEIQEQKDRIKEKERTDKLQKDKEEREAAEEIRIIKKARFESLELIGFTYPFDDLGTMPENQYHEMYEEHKKAWDKDQNDKLLAKLTKEKDEKEAEEKRVADLAPDKDKLIVVAEKLLSFCAIVPEIKDEKAQILLDNFREHLMKCAEGLKTKAAKL